MGKTSRICAWVVGLGVAGCGGSALDSPDRAPPDAMAEAGALACVGGTTACGQACVELRSDPANCGACGVSCGVGVCVNATCATLGGVVSGPDASDASASADANDATDDGLDAALDAAVVQTDSGDASATDAGGADAAPPDAGPCPTGRTLCGGHCVDVSSDSDNCSACGAACSARQTCSHGACVCVSGSTLCAGICVGTGIDSANCGACGSACDAGSVCTGGTCAAPSSNWPTFGCDLQHTGSNASETAVPPPVESWTATISATGSPIGPAAVENGRAFVTCASRFATTAPLAAVDVSDGTVLWTYNFGAVGSLGYPSVASGVVYVQTNHGTSGNYSYLWALDAGAGGVSWSAAFGSQWENFWPPLVVGTSVFIDGGEYGGLYGFHTADGSQIFFDGSLGQYDSWSPAYFGGDLYTFIDGSFSSEDPTTGNVLSTTSVTWNWSGYSMDTAPVFGPTYAYVISPPNLVAINPSTSAAAWTANGTYSGTPAVANGVVYGVSAGNLIARDASNGNLDFTLVGDQNLKYPPVVAAGYVYASSDANVYAWNVTTHAKAWTAPVGGWLAIAAGRLLVSGSDGVLRGYVLTQ